MIHRCKHVFRSICPRDGFDAFLHGLHSDAHIGTPSMDVARRDYRRALHQRTSV